MIVYNLTKSKISVLKPNSGTMVVPAEGQTSNEVASAALVRTLITMFPPQKIRIKLLDNELGVVDQIPENISNWLRDPSESIEEESKSEEPAPTEKASE